MKKYSIAVVIPAYNAEAFLCAALDSVVRQRRRPEQIIVVDDGSEDRTLERTHDWARAYKGEFRALQMEHGGVSAARNRGIELAQTDLIAFLDADDLLLPCHLEQLERAFQTNPDLTLCFGRFRYFDSQGFLRDPAFLGTGIVSVPYESQRDGLRIMQRSAYTSLLRGSYISASAALMPKSALERVGLFDETLRNGEDREIFLRLSRIGSFGYYPIVLAHKRRHDANLTHPRSEALSQRFQFLALQKTLRNAASMSLTKAELRETRAIQTEHARMMLNTASRRGLASWLQTCKFLIGQKKIVPVGNVRHFVRAVYSWLFER